MYFFKIAEIYEKIVYLCRHHEIVHPAAVTFSIMCLKIYLPDLTPARYCYFLSRIAMLRGKSGPALGGTEYRLMPSACRLIVRQP